MQRVKEARYKLAGAFVSSKSSDGGLQRLRNANDDDTPVGTYRNASLSLPNIVLHSVAIFFTFLAICTMAAVAAFQGKWFGVCEWHSDSADRSRGIRLYAVPPPA